MNFTNELALILITAIKNKFQVELGLSEIKFDPPPDPNLGDLAFACFPLARVCRTSPVKIANDLAPLLEENEIISQIDPTGPYLNISLNKAAWFKKVLGTALYPPEHEGSLLNHKLPPTEQKSYAIEFSCPNTNKPQHLGHVRNNILGLAISSLLNIAGHKVKRVNLINDRGIHICKSMLAWKLWANGETPESCDTKGDHFVGKYYVMFNTHYKEEQKTWLQTNNINLTKMTEQERTEIERQFDQNSTLSAQAREMLRNWESGDPDTIGLWKKMNAWVIKGFDETYARLGVDFDKVYFESDTYLIGKDLVKQGLEEGILRKNSTGAVVCPLDGFDKEEKILLRSDGTSIYVTQDLGNAYTRHQDLNFDEMVYVVGNEQEYHFKVLFHILEKLGYDWATHLLHFSYGMVNLTSGKMKSREGTSVDADDLLDDLEAACRRVMDESEKRSDMNESSRDTINHALADAALKYYVLKVSPRLDMIYDPKESIELTGNTGPYLQYAHARICSLVRKSGIDPASVTDFSLLKEPEEIEILKALTFWPDQVSLAVTQLNPARIATKTYELARCFSRLFNSHSIFDKVQDPKLAEQRIALVAACGFVIRQGLSLMCITAPEKI
jgi:arginyl-tRNA synthetase